MNVFSVAPKTLSAMKDRTQRGIHNKLSRSFSSFFFFVIFFLVTYWVTFVERFTMSAFCFDQILDDDGFLVSVVVSDQDA